ncbi:Elongation factor 1-alpha [Balamuthia mandrillaris]
MPFEVGLWICRSVGVNELLSLQATSRTLRAWAADASLWKAKALELAFADRRRSGCNAEATATDEDGQEQQTWQLRAMVLYALKKRGIERKVTFDLAIMGHAYSGKQSLHSTLLTHLINSNTPYDLSLSVYSSTRSNAQTFVQDTCLSLLWANNYANGSTTAVLLTISALSGEFETGLSALSGTAHSIPLQLRTALTLGVEHVIVAVSKADVVEDQSGGESGGGMKRERFEEIKKEVEQVVERSGYRPKSLLFVPYSSWQAQGERKKQVNIVKLSLEVTPWYKGCTLLEAIQLVANRMYRSLIRKMIHSSLRLSVHAVWFRTSNANAPSSSSSSSSSSTSPCSSSSSPPPPPPRASSSSITVEVTVQSGLLRAGKRFSFYFPGANSSTLSSFLTSFEHCHRQQSSGNDEDNSKASHRKLGCAVPSDRVVLKLLRPCDNASQPEGDGKETPSSLFHDDAIVGEEGDEAEGDGILLFCPPVAEELLKGAKRMALQRSKAFIADLIVVERSFIAAGKSASIPLHSFALSASASVPTLTTKWKECTLTQLLERWDARTGRFVAARQHQQQASSNRSRVLVRLDMPRPVYYLKEEEENNNRVMLCSGNKVIAVGYIIKAVME